MIPLKFKICHIDEISELLKIDLIAIPTFQEYIRIRPDIFEWVDILCENSRSVRQIYKNFDLFEEVTDLTTDTIIFCSLYLEVLEFIGQSHLARPLVNALITKYPNNKILFHWNHDIDFYSKYSWFQEFKQAYVIQFNTSKRLPNDIVVPIWNINTAPINEAKVYRGGFLGQINNPLRATLYTCLNNREGFLVEDTTAGKKYDEMTFLKKLSSCQFVFCPRGQGLSSYRFFETFHINSIPVLIADDVELPYEDTLFYTDFSIRIPEEKAGDFKYIESQLIYSEDKLTQLNSVKEKFSLKGVQELIYKTLKESL
jgi:hypothetical protein